MSVGQYDCVEDIIAIAEDIEHQLAERDHAIWSLTHQRNTTKKQRDALRAACKALLEHAIGIPEEVVQQAEAALALCNNKKGDL